jgi:hypothetical protein
MLAAERVNTPWSPLRGLVNLLFEHDLFGKPVSTFPGHAPIAFARCDRDQSARFPYISGVVENAHCNA